MSHPIHLFLTLMLFIIPEFGFAKESFPQITGLSKNWQFSFKTENSYTYFLKSNPNVVGSFHFINNTRTLDWQSIKGKTFFKQIEKQKKHLFSTIGFNNWTAKKYDWKKKKSHFELSLAGTLKDSDDKTTFFYEMHLFAPLNTLQIVITTTNPKLLAHIEVNPFINQVIHYYSKREPAFMAFQKKAPIDSISLSFHLVNFFKEKLASKIGFLIPHPKANATIPQKRQIEPCELSANNMANICKSIKQKCKKNIPKKYEMDCDANTLNPQKKALGIFSYIRGCSFGASSSISDLVTLPFRFVKGIINKLYKSKSQDKEKTYVSNSQLYVANRVQEFCENKTDNSTPCPNPKTLEQSLKKLSYSMKRVISLSLPSIVTDYHCLNSMGKSRSLCKFISNVAISSVTFAVPTIARIASKAMDSGDGEEKKEDGDTKITIVQKPSSPTVQASSSTSVLIQEDLRQIKGLSSTQKKAINNTDDLNKTGGIDKENLRLLLRAKDILETDLNEKQSLSIIEVNALPNTSTRIKTHLLRKAGFSVSQITRLKDKRAI